MVKFNLLDRLIGEGSDLADEYMMEDGGAPIYQHENGTYRDMYEDVEYEINEDEYDDAMPEGFVEIEEEEDPLQKSIERRATELSNQWIIQEYIDGSKK